MKYQSISRCCRTRVSLFAFLFVTIVTLCGANLFAEELLVHAASSLADACNKIGAIYSKKSGDSVKFNYAASNVLARQIDEGAPGDLFISADEAKMDFLEKADRLLEGTRKSLLSNALVLIVAADSRVAIASPKDLAKSEVKRIVLAEPQSVPAGIYAKKYLQEIDMWGKIIDKVIPSENVRAVLAAVESGNVDAGIVYKTDAMISKRVKVVYEVPINEGPKISYPFAVVKESKHPEAAKKLLNHFASKEGLGIFKEYGFIIQR